MRRAHRLVIIGAGPMGLAAGYYALLAGFDVDIVEADARPGGMAAHFDFDGLSIERFYHFVCKADLPTFELMNELGIGDRMRWRPTSMGYWIGGKVWPWGDPVSLLRFPHLDLISKLRYGAQMFLSTRRTDWRPLDKLTAKEWLISGSGRKAWDVLMRRLFDLKFYEFGDQVSAAWMWTRIKRVGTSRRSLLQEELGYIDGGSQTLVAALTTRIQEMGGHLHLSTPATRVRVENGRATGVETQKGFFEADTVFSTVPLPHAVRLVPDMPPETRQRYEALVNIGVICVLHKLKRPVTQHFWLNIVDSEMPIPGLIEFSNLRPLPSTVVYVPYYMPVTNARFGAPDQNYIDESFACIQRINPAITAEDRIASRVGRLRHAQPVCAPNFLDRLPPVDTPISGLKVADTSYYYPEDRGVAESVKFAKEQVARITDATLNT